MPGVPHPVAPSTPGTRSTAVLANVGNYSGPIGSTTLPSLKGSQLWVKYINARGGLNGHQVQLIVLDDGADPARNQAAVREAVEKNNVVAFLNNSAEVTGEASESYITQKRVPVVGTFGGDSGLYTSPMFFPQTSSADPGVISAISSIAQQAVPAGKTKLGLVVCAEAASCSHTDQIVNQEAKALGLDLVYRAKASITQPDYTAECLAAQSAGAQVLWILLDSNSVGRVANSCARQNYRPQFAASFGIVTDRLKEDPNFEGMIASSMTFPWFQSGTAATDQFQAALRQDGDGLSAGVGTANGWTAGKLLELAAAQLPEPPTREAILTGLWSITDNTLGGITAPLTFHRDQPAPPKSCWFNVAIRKSQWTAPDSYTMHCR